ncbi:MAG: hypothetical protein H6719_18175 [Sandaracinaceae bacterium]|nr:hypothetical protein [Sandaracinaceae bacterium]
MTRVRMIPRAELGSAVVDRCVVTGEPGAEPMAVRFYYAPRWARVSVALCGLLGVFLLLAMHRRARVVLPFTRSAWETWNRHRKTTSVLVACAVLGLLVTVGTDALPRAAGLVVFLGFLAAGVAHHLATRGLGPQCVLIDEDGVVLDLPSHLAAQALIEAGLATDDDPYANVPADAEGDERLAAYDDALERELRDMD